MKNIKMCHKVLADYFNKSHEAMRQLKRKHEATKEGLWSVYVRAYNWDTRETKQKQSGEN